MQEPADTTLSQAAARAAALEGQLAVAAEALAAQVRTPLDVIQSAPHPSHALCTVLQERLLQSEQANISALQVRAATCISRTKPPGPPNYCIALKVAVAEAQAADDGVARLDQQAKR